MADKKKAVGAGTPTASNVAFDSRNHTKTDPLTSWFNLAKPSRNREHKRSWKRGNQRGQIDTCLAGQLALLVVVVLLIVGGVVP